MHTHVLLSQNMVVLVSTSFMWFSLLQDSKFLRVHQVLPVSTFKMMDSENLVLSQPFLQFLHALPLEYNYALYREIFQRFGTHYYHSGVLGGRYDLLYQYSREELKSSGAKWTMTIKIIVDLKIEIQTVNLKICLLRKFDIQKTCWG